MITDSDDTRVRVLDHRAEATEQPRPTDGDYRELSSGHLSDHYRNLATDVWYATEYHRQVINCNLAGIQPAAEMASYILMDPIYCHMINQRREERAVEHATTDNEEPSNG